MKKIIVAIIIFMLCIGIFAACSFNKNNTENFWKDAEKDSFEIIVNNEHGIRASHNHNTGIRLFGSDDRYIVKPTAGRIFADYSSTKWEYEMELQSGETFWWMPDYGLISEIYINIYKMSGENVKSFGLIKLKLHEDDGLYYKIVESNEKMLAKDNVKIEDIENYFKNPYDEFLKKEKKDE